MWSNVSENIHFGGRSSDTSICPFVVDVKTPLGFFQLHSRASDVLNDASCESILNKLVCVLRSHLDRKGRDVPRLSRDRPVLLSGAWVCFYCTCGWHSSSSSSREIGGSLLGTCIHLAAGCVGLREQTVAEESVYTIWHRLGPCKRQICFLNWSVKTACCMHDTSNAFQWAAPWMSDGTPDDLTIGIRTMRNSFWRVVRESPFIHRAVLAIR